MKHFNHLTLLHFTHSVIPILLFAALLMMPAVICHATTQDITTESAIATTEATTAAPKPPAKIHKPGSTERYNVTKYGANGSDKKDDTKAIQKALDEAGSNYKIIVTIPAGTYYISKCLYIQSNTTLKLSKNTVIRRSKNALGKNMLRNTNSKHISTKGKNYNLSQNIRVTGGTWDGGKISKAKSTSNLIYFGHASNITIENSKVKNCFGAHAIEFAGVKNSRIRNCKISGFRYDSSGFTSEAIQLDICYKTKSEGAWAPGFAADKTPCKNITIEKCTITDYPRGIGIHHTLKKHSCSNITIRNNTFKRSSASTQGKCIAGIVIFGTDKVKITNNRFNRYSYGAIIKSSKRLSIKKNTFRYNNYGALNLSGCDRNNGSRIFSINKKKKSEENPDSPETDDKTLEFTCPYIDSGTVYVGGHSYRFSSSGSKKIIKLYDTISSGTYVNFYGKDYWNNRYYQTSWIPK